MRKILILIFFLLPQTFFGQETKKVNGEYTYISEDINESVGTAKRKALERAQADALKQAFGESIYQNNYTLVENGNEQSSIQFVSSGGSEVRGEWLETIDGPNYDINYKDGFLVVKVTVKGLVRQVIAAGVNFSAKVLRNGIEDIFESENFKANDDFYISLQSSSDGFVAIYLIDDDGIANCLLPYQNQIKGIYSIKSNKRYVFFDPKSVDERERNIVDEYFFTCNKQQEINQFYIIFSPNIFSKAVDNSISSELPRRLKVCDFENWLANCRKKDISMKVERKIVRITKQ